VIAALALRAFA
jgi:MFS family permease